MSNILSIDPGRWKVAWAFWEGTELAGCGVSRLPKRDRNLDESIDYFIGTIASELKGSDICQYSVVERMKYYPGRGKGDANSLLDLQAIGGAVGAKLAQNLKLVYPSEWKANRPKDVCQREVERQLSRSRFRKELNPETGVLESVEYAYSEREIFDEALKVLPKDIKHDLYDAVGIGLSFHRRWF